MGWSRQPITSRRIRLAGLAGPLFVTALLHYIDVLAICQHVLPIFCEATQEYWFSPKNIEPTSHHARRLDLFSVSVITLLNGISGSLEAVHGLLQSPLQ